ncbi:HcpA family protein [Helicobacter pylori]|uniref:tetratricopeptide repeat protein n=2 Tax=Helicobacter pylori TaxID=210 RepID=UPI0009897C75|nr:HcpA family protein [Helicobacter pylori]WQU36618.1 sel1 repeat family protein [Helicobacter pylori]
MLGNFKKAIFRVLCLCLLGGGLMANQTPKELFDQGVKSNKAKDYIQAKKYFEKACNLNCGGGCGALGDLYDDGKGVEKNLIKATQLYTKACELKEGVGCKRLWSLYYYGRGVEKDLTKADQYISKACKLGDQEACEALKEK